MATCPVITSIQLIDLLNDDFPLPVSIAKIKQVLYDLNKGPALERALFPETYTAEQIETEYTNFVSTRLIQAMKETEFWSIYALTTQDQIKFDINSFNYFYKRLTYNVISVYDSLVLYHADDLRELVRELERRVKSIHLKVLLENAFNPVNKVWGFSAIATLYCMYIRIVGGEQ